jgi:hypothetical protein
MEPISKPLADKRTHDGKRYIYCITCGVLLVPQNHLDTYKVPCCIDHYEAYQQDARNVRRYPLHEQPYVVNVRLSMYDCESGAPIHCPASKYGPAEYARPLPDRARPMWNKND